jgi:endogenous inhibitor of DNA gyrase (YacG/DUF329 family)
MKLKENLNKCYDKLGRIISGAKQRNFIIECEDYDNYPGITLAEKVYLLKNNQTEIPKCPTCGKGLIWHKIGGYRTYCCNKCRSNNYKWKEKRIGKGFQSKKVQQKIKLTIKEKYGVDNISQLQSTKNKIKNKLRIKGQEWRNSQEAIDLATEKIESFGYKVINTRLENNETVYSIKCEKHNKIWDWDRQMYLRNHTQGYPFCSECHNEKTSKGEQEIFEFVKSIYSNEILRNARNIIFPKEIDIYLPELKFGIEFCGLYWHSQQYLGKNYHREKWELAQQNGIDLMQIWDVEWHTKKSILKSIISNRLGLSVPIYARNCDIKKVPSKEAREFANTYHLQGFYRGIEYVGLYYNNELIDLSIFCKCRFGKQYDYELTRHCIKSGFRVIGALSREIVYFKKLGYNGSIVDYCDQRLFNGKGHWGFKETGMTPPDMQYTDFKTIIPRGKYQKYRMKNIKGFKFDSSLTQLENLRINRMDFIYGVGHKIFVYDLV